MEFVTEGEVAKKQKLNARGQNVDQVNRKELKIKNKTLKVSQNKQKKRKILAFRFWVKFSVVSLSAHFQL